MKSVELFAGAGGLAIGMAKAGFQHAAVIEWDHDACETFRLNQQHHTQTVEGWPLHEMDARMFEFKSLGSDVTVVSGGPPCQPFSMGGRHLAQRDERNMFPEANLDDFAKQAMQWMQEQEKHGNDPLLGPYSEARDRVHAVLELLTNEFNDRDPLLSKQGEIPIYYWLAREHPNWVDELHDFVNDFSQAVLQNLRTEREAPGTGDAELTSYYTMSRTTNDQSSLDGRFRIFRRRFGEYRKPAGRRRA
jgi:hypothetical protein